MSPQASPLQTRILSQLQTRFSGAQVVGQRLNEVDIAEWLGVSRTPVREVLRALERQGTLVYEPRRGYEIVQPLDPETGSGADGDELLDERVMREMALGTLKSVISERALLKRFAVPRGFLNSTLRRLMRDQLVEPSPGRGWVFADIGPDALRDGYRFRQIVEPAAILCDDYAVDRKTLDALDRDHAAAIESINAMEQRALFELDARFHRVIAAGAGSRQLDDVIRRQNNIRRVADYISFVRPERIRQSLIEHRGIIAALLDNRRQHAAMLMRLHLEVSADETFAHLNHDLERIRARGSLSSPADSAG
ncbi:GntR family transcriptional regulator [Chelatococcus asaccharovorans]|uniref:DNA-binding GntR family transcriptional regulator n=1 Tax=Chelatococcus asaccharovorans TaxID=28210 RepID=A0A2V3U7J5_9HYPH|nr:GntR family transcriptional regulator [Chelatococcus asaccharovorans]MBS7705682.1 GntR family transcriptional regulator [Chelatococcus asaccharovorans]PXW58700.1 DNA-binding GntR family transcriptional regulator [Chelatococcus asaccharovorans]